MRLSVPAAGWIDAKLHSPEVVIAHRGRRAADFVLAELQRQQVQVEVFLVLDQVLQGGDHLFRHLDGLRRLDRDWLKALLADIAARKVRDIANPKLLGRQPSDAAPARRRR